MMIHGFVFYSISNYTSFLIETIAFLYCSMFQLMQEISLLICYVMSYRKEKSSFFIGRWEGNGRRI